MKGTAASGPPPRFYHPGIRRFTAPVSPARPVDGADSTPRPQEAGAPDWFMLITVSLLPGLSDQFRDRYLTQMVNMAGGDLRGLRGREKRKVFLPLELQEQKLSFRLDGTEGGSNCRTCSQPPPVHLRPGNGANITEAEPRRESGAQSHYRGPECNQTSGQADNWIFQLHK